MPASDMTGLSQYAATQWWRSNLDATGAEAPVAHAVEFSKTVAARLAGSPRGAHFTSLRHEKGLPGEAHEHGSGSVDR